MGIGWQFTMRTLGKCLSRRRSKLRRLLLALRYLAVTVQFAPSQYARTWLEPPPVMVAPHVVVVESLMGAVMPSSAALHAGSAAKVPTRGIFTAKSAV